MVAQVPMGSIPQSLTTSNPLTDVFDEANPSPRLPLGYLIFAFAVFLTIIAPLNDFTLSASDFATRDLDTWMSSALRLVDLFDFILLRSVLMISLVCLPPICTLVGLLVLIPSTSPISETQEQTQFRIVFIISSIAVGLFAIAVLVKNCHSMIPDQNISSDSVNCLDGQSEAGEQSERAVTAPMSSSETIVGDWSNQSRGLEGTRLWEEAKPGMRPMTPDDDVLLQMIEAMM